MPRAVVLLLASVLPILGACLPLHAPSHAGGASDLEGMTIALVDPEDGRPYCSGVWIGERQILTALHCVEDALVEADGEISYSAREDLYIGPELRDHPVTRGGRVVNVDTDHDLALLNVEPGPPHPVAEINDEAIRPGDEVQVMGHSVGLGWSYSRGDVAAVRYMTIGLMSGLWLQTTAPSSPGNSGGGAFDAHGHLIGICHGGARRGQNINLFVHRTHIATFLKESRA